MTSQQYIIFRGKHYVPEVVTATGKRELNSICKRERVTAYRLTGRWIKHQFRLKHPDEQMIEIEPVSGHKLQPVSFSAISVGKLKEIGWTEEGEYHESRHQKTD